MKALTAIVVGTGATVALVYAAFRTWEERAGRTPVATPDPDPLRVLLVEYRNDNPFDVEVVCAEVEAQCRCILPPGHAAHHRCECGGQWLCDANGNLVDVVAWPGSNQAWSRPWWN